MATLSTKIGPIFDEKNPTNFQLNPFLKRSVLELQFCPGENPIIQKGVTKSRQTNKIASFSFLINMFFFGLRKGASEIFISWVTDAEQVYGETIGLVAKMRPAKRREVELVELKVGHTGKLRWEPEVYNTCLGQENHLPNLHFFGSKC